MTGGAGGGAVRSPCGGTISTTPPDVLADSGGALSNPALVFGSANGSEVAVFHGFRPDGSAGTALHASSYAWSGNEPSVTFAVDPNGGDDFAVSSVAHGNVALALHQIDPNDGSESLGFAGLVSAGSPGWLPIIPIATSEEHGRAVRLVPGYDNPPVAFNVGYLATLVTWDAKLPTTTIHSLEMAVGTSGVGIVGGLVGNADDPLACAKSPIAADAIRAGSSWIVAAASGSELGPCDSVDVGAPTSLAIDKITWGPPDTVTWTVDRVTTLKGDGAIRAVRMVAADSDGGWIVVEREGHTELQLLRVREDGKVKLQTDVRVTAESATLGAISLLDGGALIAFATQEHPNALHLQLFDADGNLSASAAPSLSSAFGASSMLASVDGAKSLLAWADDLGRIQTMQIGCTQ